jgi:cytochrome c-type biogenesis protein CcmE
MRWWPRTAGIGVIAAVVAYLVWGGIGNSLVYFLTPSELLARGVAVQGAPVRLGGLVQPGTTHWDAARRELHFRLQDQSHAIDVVSVGLPPGMFTEGIGAIVEGVYSADGVFHSHNVMVKHSNEYRAPGPGVHPTLSYRELLGRGAGAPGS